MRQREARRVPLSRDPSGARAETATKGGRILCSAPQNFCLSPRISRSVGNMTKTKTLLLIAAIFVALFILLVWQHEGIWKIHQLIGLAIMVPSFLLWGLARLQLGESFSIRPQAKALVTRGLYSRIRNPVYLFGGLMSAGLFTFYGNPYLFLIFLILVPLQVIRLHKESQVLEDTFGETYRAYKRQTWL